LASDDCSPEERETAQALVNDWRASFSFPLRVVYDWLRKASQEVEAVPLVSRRLKRMESIVAKLRRSGNVSNLSTVQDIGGCRVVLPDFVDVVELLGKNKSLNESGKLSKIRDHIADPKPDGYRSIHVVAPVRFNTPKYAAWNVRKIEIQIRSALQHAWATAVETVDLFSNQALKVGGGDPRWRRFFLPASTVFAAQERAPMIPSVPKNFGILEVEIRQLLHDLDVANRMRLWAHTLHEMPVILSSERRQQREASVFLVVVDATGHNLTVNAYQNDHLAVATEHYAKIEQEIREGRNAHAVLVAVGKLNNLREAYPNLYADTNAFLKGLSAFLKELL
jgi:hypothetical protein